MLDRTIPPALHHFSQLRYDFPNHLLLPNGVKLYVINGGDQDVTKLEVLYKGGLFDESKPMQAALMTSMLQMGTENMTSAQISEKFDFFGSWFSSQHQDNYTHTTLHSLNKYFNESYELFLDILSKPSFPTSELELLKTQYKGAYHTARKQVKYLASVTGNATFFGANHPLALDPSDDDINAISSQDLIDFHKRYYRPENCTIIISGKVEDWMIQKIADTLGSEPAQQPAATPTVPHGNHSNEHLVFIDKPQSLQSAVSIMIEAIPRTHPDYIKLRILVTALGGYFGSRLMRNIREEKGYTYGINASLMGRKNSAYIAISSECATQYTMPLIDEIKHEIELLQKEILDDDELDAVKNYMLSDLAKSIDSPFSMASIVHSKLFFGIDDNYYNNQVKQIQDITSHELQQIALKHINCDKMYIIVAGDKSAM